MKSQFSEIWKSKFAMFEHLASVLGALWGSLVKSHPSTSLIHPRARAYGKENLNSTKVEISTLAIIHVHTEEGIMNDLNSIWNPENKFISAK